MTATETTKSKKPTHAVFHVTGKEDKARWNRIGAAWAHKDGKGFNLDLDMIPMKTGRFVIRENRPEDAKEEKEGQ
jgi:hypothetical protein